MSETISEGIINCLIVTNSSEANVQLTRIHEHLFAREYLSHSLSTNTQIVDRVGDPTVASVWRRQTFSAAVESRSPEMSQVILLENMPGLTKLLAPVGGITQSPSISILESAYEFSRMLHSSNSSSGGSADAFYRAFVPELGSTLYPRQIELVKRCLRSERGETDRVGATIFPGLVKITRGPVTPGRQNAENVQTVVRRAQVICECAMDQTGGSMANAPDGVNGYNNGYPG